MEITPVIYDYINKTVKDTDLKQDVFVSLLEKADVPEFETPQLLRNWLSVFISNRVKTERNTVANRDRIMEENGNFIRDIYGSNGESADPMELAIAEELEAELLGSLTELEKDIYGMVIAADLCSYAEAAKILLISEVALRQHVTRIKRKFNGKTTGSKETNEEIHS